MKSIVDQFIDTIKNTAPADRLDMAIVMAQVKHDDRRNREKQAIAHVQQIAIENRFNDQKLKKYNQKMNLMRRHNRPCR